MCKIDILKYYGKVIQHQHFLLVAGLPTQSINIWQPENEMKNLTHCAFSVKSYLMTYYYMQNLGQKTSLLSAEGTIPLASS